MQVRVSETTTNVATWRDYVELAKPGVVFMLALTTLAAMFVAADGLPSLWITFFTILSSLMALAAACVLNSYLEIELDELMTRTRNRPLVTGCIKSKDALLIGLVLSALSFLLLGFNVNWLSAALMLAGIVLYVFVYTLWLKKRSGTSTFVGGLISAIPVLVGWTAITGTFSIEALTIAAIVIYWTPPHYWSLALIRRAEYIRAGIPVVPVVQGPNFARLQIGRYSVLLVILTLLPVGMGLLEKYYALAALVLGGFLVVNAIQLYQSPSSQTALRYYKNSLLYFALLFAAMLADRAIL